MKICLVSSVNMGLTLQCVIASVDCAEQKFRRGNDFVRCLLLITVVYINLDTYQTDQSQFLCPCVLSSQPDM